MANIIIAGRFARDAEMRYTADGTGIASFSIAEDVYQSKQKKAQFWECSLFGKRAESLAMYIKKGGSATVFGEAIQEKYTGKDGIERTVTKVRVNDITLQGSANSQAEPPSPPTRQTPATRQPVEDVEDDVPF